jgi:hypothetical protein
MDWCESSFIRLFDESQSEAEESVEEVLPPLLAPL